MSDIFSPAMIFKCSVNEAGYLWERREPAFSESGVAAPYLDNLYLVEKKEGGRGKEGRVYREYYPLTSFVGLYRTLAATPPTEEGILRFANSYGPLGSIQQVGTLLLGQARATDAPTREAFGLWALAIRELALASDVSQMLEEDDTNGLSGVFSQVTPDLVGGGKAIIRGRDSSMPCSAEEEEVTTETVGAGSSDIMKIARLYLSEAVTNHLSGKMTVTVEWNRESGSWHPIMAPCSLETALWLQLAIDLSSRGKLQQCKECGVWFPVGAGKARSDRRYCSPACRTRASRSRRDEAAELYSRNFSLQEIADQVGSDLVTVQRWQLDWVSPVSKSRERK